MADSSKTALANLVISTKISALHIYKQHLLVGEGPYLHIYNLTKNDCVSTLNVFTAAVIHGVKLWNHLESNLAAKFMVWGQKSIAVTCLNSITFTWECVSQEYEVEDWIIDAACSNDGSSILVATAHNVFIKLDASPFLQNSKTLLSHKNNAVGGQSSSKSKNDKLIIITRRKCCHDSLMYSGLIIGTSFNSCMVLGGTAFGKIVIWAPWTISAGDGQIKPLFILSGPKGAIFSINFDPDENVLVTTSDDRSVRLWKVSCLGDKEDLVNQRCSTSEVEDYQKFWLNCQINEIFCSYGHNARVWQSVFLDNKTIMSCGEDSSICHWSKDGQLLTSWVAHSGSNVWCMTTSNNILITGGGDGAVKVWKCETKNKISKDSHPYYWTHLDIWGYNDQMILSGKPIGKNFSKPKETLINEDSLSQSKLKIANKNSFPRTINLLDASTAVMVSDDGCVWLWKECNKRWIIVYENELLEGYAVSAINEHTNIIALGTLSGTIILLDVVNWECLYKQSISSCKLQSLFFIQEDILVSCNGVGQVEMWKVVNDGSIQLQLMRKHSLPSCRLQWITSAALVREGSVECYYLVVGDPCGSVHLYVPNKLEPIDSLKRLHGKCGVTGIYLHDSYLITSGRDGHINFLVAESNHIHVVYDMKLSIGSWICGVVSWNHCMIALIFSGAFLQLWNIDDGQILFEIDCGGGHRAWDAFIGSKRFKCCGKLQNSLLKKESPHITYAFLKNGLPVICEASFNCNLLRTIKMSLSGREIQCLELLWVNNESVLFTFGGEDTILHTQLLRNKSLHSICKIKSHLSSVRSMTKIRNFVTGPSSEGPSGVTGPSSEGPSGGLVKNEKDGYLISCGGRGQLKVWKISLTKRGTKLMNTHYEGEQEDAEQCMVDASISNLFNPAILCKEMISHTIRAGSNYSWKNQKLTYDPETRYMDSVAFWAVEGIALIIVASSDGFIRFFKYSTEGQLDIIYEEDCFFCLLRVSLIRCWDSVIVMGSTTRGNLIFWNIKELIELLECFDSSDDFSKSMLASEKITEFQVHPSGITSLGVFEDSEMTNECETFIGTGGDDGSLHILRMINKRDIILPKISLCCKSGRHASQVSGLSWLTKNRICSVSIDQRLILWKLKLNHLDAYELEPLFVHYCSIPDIQGLRLLSTNFTSIDKKQNKLAHLTHNAKLFVYGTGVQIFDIPVSLLN